VLQATPTSSTGEQIFVNVQASDAGFDWFGLITVLFTIAIAAPTWVIQQRTQQEVKRWRKEDLEREADRDKPKLLVELGRIETNRERFFRLARTNLSVVVRNYGQVPVVVTLPFLVGEPEIRMRFPRDSNDSDNSTSDVPFSHSFVPGESRRVTLYAAKVDENMLRASVSEAVLRVQVTDGLSNTYVSNPLAYSTASSEDSSD